MSGIPHVTHADVCTCAKCNAKANRIAAFGAIRRAAEVARRIERDTTWDDVDDGLGDLITAAGIREAIRAAIGSQKA